MDIYNLVEATNGPIYQDRRLLISVPGGHNPERTTPPKCEWQPPPRPQSNITIIVFV